MNKDTKTSVSATNAENATSGKDYYSLAEESYDKGDKSKTISYCDKILEIEPKSYKAWFLKGKASGQQSADEKCNIKESAQCFSKAIGYAPDEKTEELKKGATENMSQNACDAIGLYCRKFVDSNSGSKTDILSEISDMHENASKFISEIGFETTKFNTEIVTIIHRNAEESVEKTYSLDMNRSDFNKFKETCANSTELLELALKICETSQDKISTYQYLIQLTNKLNNAMIHYPADPRSIDRYHSDHRMGTHLLEVGNVGSWRESSGSYSDHYSNDHPADFYGLSDEEQKANVDKIMMYHKKIKELDPSHKIPKKWKYKNSQFFQLLSIIILPFIIFLLLTFIYMEIIKYLFQSFGFDVNIQNIPIMTSCVTGSIILAIASFMLGLSYLIKKLF